MPQTVVVWLDGSADAERVLPLAEVFAHHPSAHLVLVRAVSGGLFASQEDEHQLALEAQRDLARLRLRIAAPARVLTEVLFGDPAGVLVEAVYTYKADLVVMASVLSHHGEQVQLPAAAYPVLAHLPVPVLVCNPSQAIGSASQLRRNPRILVPLDGSHFAEAALPLAGALAFGLHSKLVLAHAVQAVDPLMVADLYGLGALTPGVDRAAARAYLEMVADYMAEAQRSDRPRIYMRLGAVPDVIGTIADEQDVAAIVMATHARSGLYRLLRLSVTAHVLRQAHVPVILVRPQALSTESANSIQASTRAAHPSALAVAGTGSRFAVDEGD